MQKSSALTSFSEKNQCQLLQYNLDMGNYKVIEIVTAEIIP